MIFFMVIIKVFLSAYSTCFFCGIISDAPMLMMSTATMKSSDAMASISRYSWMSILAPMNTKSTQTPVFR